MIVLKANSYEQGLTRGKRYGGAIVARQNGVRFTCWNDNGQWETYDLEVFEPTQQFFEAVEGPNVKEAAPIITGTEGPAVGTTSETPPGAGPGPMVSTPQGKPPKAPSNGRNKK